jgi:hypothetical protein
VPLAAVLLRVVGETVAPPRRRRKSEVRPREYLTPAEVDSLAPNTPRTWSVRASRHHNPERLPAWAIELSSSMLSASAPGSPSPAVETETGSFLPGHGSGGPSPERLVMRTD